ncbi:E3 ubiquitin-protein ligase TRIM23-like [Macrobrachium rosenbergii]|uniref:E3 ubiquitin-protein ligase TRIM23-like n=1 Tax=Macrobrachium rosenbergii TaxID=79674 RepID=UPI0034D40596
MASSPSKECGICNNAFDDGEHCPRILSCFHCLCSECIDQLIESEGVTCPFCRRRMEATSVQSFSVNTCLLELLKYVAELETTRKSHSWETANFEGCLEGFREGVSKINLTHCQTAKSQLKSSIQGNCDLRNGILEAKRKIKDDVLTKMKQMERNYERQLVHLEEQNDILRRQLNMLFEKERLLKHADEKLQEASDFAMAGPIMDQTEEITGELKTIVNDLKDILSWDEICRLSIQKVLQNTNEKIGLIEEILTSQDDEDQTGLLADVNALVADEDVPKTIDARGLLVISSPERQLAREGKVYAVQEREGRRIYAKITLSEEGKVCLHCLRQELGPPPSALTISYDDVTSLLDTSVRVAFLELAAEDRTLGKLFIRLSPETKFAQHFAALCTGEMGPSYADTRVLEVMRKDSHGSERVLFGDYENNDGSGGKALVPGLGWGEWMKETHIYPAVAGAVGSVLGTEDNAAQFVILTKDCPGQNLGGCFGTVEEGLHFLTEIVSQYSNIRDVNIQDCGVLLDR